MSEKFKESINIDAESLFNFINDLKDQELKKFFKAVDITSFPKEIKRRFVEDTHYNKVTKPLNAEFKEEIRDRNASYRKSLDKIFNDVCKITFDDYDYFCFDVEYTNTSDPDNLQSLTPDKYGFISLDSLTEDCHELIFKFYESYMNSEYLEDTKLLNSLSEALMKEGFSIKSWEFSGSYDEFLLCLTLNSHKSQIIMKNL